MGAVEGLERFRGTGAASGHDATPRSLTGRAPGATGDADLPALDRRDPGGGGVPAGGGGGVGGVRWGAGKVGSCFTRRPNAWRHPCAPDR